MFNKNLFKEVLREHGHTLKDISRIMGINEATLCRKMSGVSDFNRNEIWIFKQTYALNAEQIDAIFFRK